MFRELQTPCHERKKKAVHTIISYWICTISSSFQPDWIPEEASHSPCFSPTISEPNAMRGTLRAITVEDKQEGCACSLEGSLPDMVHIDIYRFWLQSGIGLQKQVAMTADGQACSILPLGQKWRMWGIELLASLGSGFGRCLCGH